MVTADGTLKAFGKALRCALGPGGIVPPAQKQEGDGAAPSGTYDLRQVFYRPDRLAEPETDLTVTPLTKQDLWCDDPNNPHYNSHVRAPFEASHERLWRDDHLYDVIVVLGINDDPVVPGKGSAIFLHLARGDYEPTEGCVAVNLTDMKGILSRCSQTTTIEFKL